MPKESIQLAFMRWQGLSPDLLAEQARRDQRMRWDRGDRLLAERYLEALPSLADSPDDALVLIYGEALLRADHGEALDMDAMIGRFPQYRESLEHVFDLHRLMSTSSDSMDRDAPPPAIEGYGDVEFHARGGMGTVYRAVHLQMGRPVAIKVVRHEQASAEEVVRFLQEVDTLARLASPYVVRLLDRGVCDRGPYLVTPWAAGGSLDARLNQGLSLRHIGAIIRDVARALQVAHAASIIHRDVKPGNILLPSAELSTEGVIAQLADFGLARMHSCGGTLTATGDVLGTWRYMPPEQLDGRSRDVGPWSDLYSLAATMYELLTGQSAFADRQADQTSSSGGNPVSLRSLNAAVPEHWEQACLRAMRYNPAERFQHAADFLIAMQLH